MKVPGLILGPVLGRIDRVRPQPQALLQGSDHTLLSADNIVLDISS